jgi:hypothetical protein
MSRFAVALALAACFVASAGCTSPLVRAASRESREGFRATLGAFPAPSMSSVEARRVAFARASFELRTAEGLDGQATVRALSRCAPSLEDGLRARAAKRDDIGAVAAMALLDSGRAAPLEFGSSHAVDDVAWAAVAARSLTLAGEDASAAPCDVGWSDCVTGESSRGARTATLRRRLFLDGHAEVRRAALRAAVDAADVYDAQALLDAAHRDPDATARLLAFEALGNLADAAALGGLADAWVLANTAERVAIVRAFTASLRKGGGPRCDGSAEPVGCLAFRRLWRVMELEQGEPSLLAAMEVARASSNREGAAWPSTTAEGLGLAVLERAIDAGPADLRVKAIGGAPLEHAALLEAVIEASRSEEPSVAIAALLRLAAEDTPVLAAERSAAAGTLRESARRDDGGARLALEALVALRDLEAKPLLLRHASSKVVAERKFVAESLAHLGAYAESLVFATDADAEVRSTALCAVLESAGRL